MLWCVGRWHKPNPIFAVGSCYSSGHTPLSITALSASHQHFIINMKCNKWHCQQSNINQSPTLPLKLPGFTIGFLMWIPFWMLLISTFFIADNWLQIYKARYWIPNINLVKFRWTVKTKTTGFHLLFLLRPSFHNEAHSF